MIAFGFWAVIWVWVFLSDAPAIWITRRDLELMAPIVDHRVGWLTPSMQADKRDRFTLGDPDRRLDHTDRFARRQAHPTSLGFDFDEGASATESVAIGETLELTSRDALNESLRETFIDEDI